MQKNMSLFRNAGNGGAEGAITPPIFLEIRKILSLNNSVLD